MYMKSVRLPSCYASLLQVPARSAVFTCVLTILQIFFFFFVLFSPCPNLSSTLLIPNAGPQASIRCRWLCPLIEPAR